MKKMILLLCCVSCLAGCAKLSDFGQNQYGDVAPDIVLSVNLTEFLEKTTGDSTIKLSASGSVSHTSTLPSSASLELSVEGDALSLCLSSPEPVDGVVTVTLPVDVPYYQGVEGDYGVENGAGGKSQQKELSFPISFDGVDVVVDESPRFIPRVYYFRNLPNALTLENGSNGSWYELLTICEHDGDSGCPTKDNYSSSSCDCVEECLTKSEASGSPYESLGDYTADGENYIESKGLGSNATWGGNWALETCAPGMAEMTIPYSNKVVIGFIVDEYGRFRWKELRAE